MRSFSLAIITLCTVLAPHIHAVMPPPLEFGARIYFSTNVAAAFVLTRASVTLDDREDFGFRISSGWPMTPEDIPMIVGYSGNVSRRSFRLEGQTHEIHAKPSVAGFLRIGGMEADRLNISSASLDSVEGLKKIQSLDYVVLCRNIVRIHLLPLCESYVDGVRDLRNVCPIDVSIAAANPGCVWIEPSLIRRIASIQLPPMDDANQSQNMSLVASPTQIEWLRQRLPHYACIGINEFDDPIGSGEEKDVFVSYNERVGAAEMGPFCVHQRGDEKAGNDYYRKKKALLKNSDVLDINVSETD